MNRKKRRRKNIKKTKGLSPERWKVDNCSLNTRHGTEIANVTPNISIYWLFGRKQVYFPPWEQLFPLALPSRIVSVSRDNELDIVLIASK